MVDIKQEYFPARLLMSVSFTGFSGRTFKVSRLSAVSTSLALTLKSEAGITDTYFITKDEAIYLGECLARMIKE